MPPLPARERRSCWTVIVIHSDDTTREHDTAGRCWCKPTIRRVLPGKRFARLRP